MANIGVIGAGTFGMALARMLANNGSKVSVWTKHGEKLDEYEKMRIYPKLKNMRIPESIGFEKDIAKLCADKDILIFAVPSVFVRETARLTAPFISEDQVIVNVAKGIEADTLMTLTEVIEDELNRNKVQPETGYPLHAGFSDTDISEINPQDAAPADLSLSDTVFSDKVADRTGTKAYRSQKVRVVALSGPTHAEEIARDIPSAIVSSSRDMEAARYVQDVFMNTCMRVYTNPDVKGVELGGAMKNIMALAAGIAQGLGYGDNTKAAIVTRGLAEIARLGTAMGCSSRTFAGLAGVGDLIVTATSMNSRNNRAGILIGGGKSAEEAKAEIGMVVEGINAIPAALELAEKYDIELPIIEAVAAIINEGADPKATVMALMSRNKKDELESDY